MKFIQKHKSRPKDFTRTRKLPFSDLFILILRNSIKSLQLMLNEFVIHCNKTFCITASAFTQARSKLKHTAYEELNNSIVSQYYNDKPFKTLFGFRVIGCDGSKLILLDSEEIKNEFGSRSVVRTTGKDLGEYSSATFMACYDVLNGICVKSILDKGSSYEAALANKMLEDFSKNDLLIFDRGYAAYEFMANLSRKNINFIIRCPKQLFHEVHKAFEEGGPSDSIVTINVPTGKIKKVRESGLPFKITIRLIRIILSTGEIEVLATSLLNQNEFKHKEFEGLYFLRWGVEGYFSMVKGRLNIENFTGRSVESIKQDFWSTIFVSNLETILTEDVEEDINNNLSSGNLKRSINKAVSFNAIKNLAFDLLSTNMDQDLIVEKLKKLFLMNTHVLRAGRTALRKKGRISVLIITKKELKNRFFDLYFLNIMAVAIAIGCLQLITNIPLWRQRQSMYGNRWPCNITA